VLSPAIGNLFFGAIKWDESFVWHQTLGPVCLGCGWLAVHGKLLCRKSCCAGEAAVLNLTVWQLSWLSGYEQTNCLKYPEFSEHGYLKNKLPI
jgi:hypothetical protein